MSRPPARTARRSAVAALLVGLTAACTGTTGAPPPQAVLAPAAAAADDPVLVAAGDIACDPADPSFNGGRGTSTACKMAKTARQAAAQSPDVVAVLGDMQYEAATSAGIAASYDRSWGALRSLTRPTIGNHEYRAGGGAPYWAYFGSRAGTAGKGWYSYELGSWHVVVLNSNCTVVSCLAGSAQERWLRADLVAHPARCTLAYWHHPRWSSGSHGDNPAVQPLLKALYDAAPPSCSPATTTTTSASPRRAPTGPAAARTASAASSSEAAARTSTGWRAPRTSAASSATPPTSASCGCSSTTTRRGATTPGGWWTPAGSCGTRAPAAAGRDARAGPGRGVGRVGLEPTRVGLKVRCSAS